QGDAVTDVRIAASQIGRVDEGGAGGIELRHEGVSVGGQRVPDGGLEPPRGGGKVLIYRRCTGIVGGCGRSCNIGVASTIHRDAVTDVHIAPAEVGGVDEGGAGGIERGHE